MNSKLQDHRALLAELIQKLEEEEQPFYANQAEWNYRAWHIAAFAGIAISVAAAIIAELIDGKLFDMWGKPTLTILPLIGTGIAAVGHVCKFREREALREEGRIEVEDIIANAKSLAASAKEEEDFKAAYHAVRERSYVLERKQHSLDVALRSNKAEEDKI